MVPCTQPHVVPNTYLHAQDINDEPMTDECRLCCPHINYASLPPVFKQQIMPASHVLAMKAGKHAFRQINSYQGDWLD